MVSGGPWFDNQVAMLRIDGAGGGWTCSSSGPSRSDQRTPPGSRRCWTANSPEGRNSRPAGLFWPVDQASTGGQG